MKRTITIHDIAKKAKVSSATVSRVLSNSNYPVSAATREIVLQTASELNYIPNLLGKQLKTNTNMTIAVIIPSITNPFYSSVILGIEEIARKYRYHILLCNSLHDPKLEEEYIKTIFEKQVRGLIISSISSNRKLLRRLMDMGLHVIALDQTIDEKEVCRIEFDYVRGGMMAASYLLGKGHREIAFLTLPLNRPSRKSIFEGYVNAMREAGLEPVIIELENEKESGGLNEFESGRKLARKVLGLRKLPTAVFACNDMVAVGAVNEFTVNGVMIPQDLSVVGFDGIEIGQVITPPLTTIKQPDYEMGKLACNMLIEMLNEQSETVLDIMLQPKLIERQSVSQVMQEELSKN